MIAVNFKKKTDNLNEEFWQQVMWWEMWLKIYHKCVEYKKRCYIDTVDQGYFRLFYHEVSKEMSKSYSDSVKQWLLYKKRTFFFPSEIERFIKTFFSTEPKYGVHNFQSYALIILTLQTGVLLSHLQKIASSEDADSRAAYQSQKMYVDSCNADVHALVQAHYLVLRDYRTADEAVEFWQWFKAKSQSFFNPKWIWIDID